MFIRRTVCDFQADAQAIAKIRVGRIVMESGKLVRIESHWLPNPVSIAQVWWQTHRGRMVGDRCILDFHIPSGVSNFITLDYIRSGRGTTYRTFVGACRVLDDVARLRRSVGIVAHVTNPDLSDRLLARLGWQSHLDHWRGRHFIRRFYDGYPEPSWPRYAAG